MMQRGVTTGALLITWLILLTPPASAMQPVPAAASPEAPPGWDFDFDLFETLMQSRGLMSHSGGLTELPHDQWTQVFRNPSDSVMILTGTIPADLGWSQIHRFLANGGAVLIATNEPFSVRGFFRIEYGPVVTMDRRDSWLGHHDCIPVTRINQSSAITEDVRRIVTNRAGWISELQSSLDYRWTLLARYPEAVLPEQSQQKLLAAMATGQNSGRMIVMADDSPLSNGMLWHGDNLKLLLNIVQELTRGQRRHYAFVHNGRPVQNRVTEMLVEEALNQQQELPEIPPEALAELPADALLEIGNTVAASIQESDVLNELAVNRPRSLQDRFYRRSILLAVCGAAIAFFLIRSWLTGQSVLPWQRNQRPPETPEHPASLSGLQYDEAVQALSRDTCRLLTASQDPNDWKATLSPDGSIWRQLSTRSESPQATIDTIAQVLDWSLRAPDSPPSRREFERFGEAIYRLKQLHVPEDARGSGLAWT